MSIFRRASNIGSSSNSSKAEENSPVNVKLNLSDSPNGLPADLYQTRPSLFSKKHPASRIQQLLLRRNRLQSLHQFSEALFNMEASLTELSLRENSFSQFPMEVKMLKNLTSLSLAYNNLVTIPDTIFPELQQLRWLNLRGNRLEALPVDIVCCHHLSGLDLDNNRIIRFPEVIFFLTRLEILMMSHNRLTSIPLNHTFPTSITTLDLSSNRLTEIPATLVYKPPPRISYLQLSGNPLRSLPPDFLKIGYQHIVSLDFHTCGLTTLSSDFFTRLGRRCPELRRLNLAINQIAELPSEIGLCQQITWLNLNDNRLKYLPEAMANMVHLVKLGLVKNKLTGLPDNLFDNMKQLLKLDIRQNELVFFPSSIMALLPYSEVEQTPLTAAPYKVFHMHEKNIAIMEEEEDDDDDEENGVCSATVCHVCRCYHPKKQLYDAFGNTLQPERDMVPAAAAAAASSASSSKPLALSDQLYLQYTTDKHNCCHRRSGGSLRTLMVCHNAVSLQHADGILCELPETATDDLITRDTNQQNEAVAGEGTNDTAEKDTKNKTRTVQIIALKDAFEILQQTRCSTSHFTRNSSASLKHDSRSRARKKERLYQACFYKEVQNEVTLQGEDSTSSSDNSIAVHEMLTKRPRTYRFSDDMRFTMSGRRRMHNNMTAIDMDDDEEADNNDDPSTKEEKLLKEQRLTQAIRQQLTSVPSLYEISIREQLDHITKIYNSFHGRPDNKRKRGGHFYNHSKKQLLNIAFPQDVIPPLVIERAIERPPRQCTFCLGWYTYSFFSIGINTRVCGNRMQIPVRHSVCSLNCALDAMIQLYEHTMDCLCAESAITLELPLLPSLAAFDASNVTNYQRSIESQRSSLAPALQPARNVTRPASLTLSTTDPNEVSSRLQEVVRIPGQPETSRTIQQSVGSDHGILNHRQHTVQDQNHFGLQEVRIEYATPRIDERRLRGRLRQRIERLEFPPQPFTYNRPHPIAVASRLGRMVINCAHRIQAMPFFQNHFNQASSSTTTANAGVTEFSSISSNSSPESTTEHSRPGQNLVLDSLTQPLLDPAVNLAEAGEHERIAEQQRNSQLQFQLSDNAAPLPLLPTELSTSERINSPRPNLTAFNHLPKNAIRLERF